jgi:signal transduction histidine kinase
LLGKYDEGYRFAKLGDDLVRRNGLVAYEAASSLAVGYHAFWTRHVGLGLSRLEEGLQASAASGALIMSCYVCVSIASIRFARGDPLDEVERQAERMLGIVRGARFGEIEDTLLALRRLVRRLRGRCSPPNSTEGPGTEDEGFDARARGGVAVGACRHHVLQLQERFLFGEYREALAAAAEANELLWACLIFWERCEHSYYLALTVAALHGQASPGEREEFLRALRAEVALHRTWAENCPENFQNRYALVSAELARLEGRELDAERLYEEAIRSAHEDGFVQNEALAYELCAHFYRVRGRGLIADTYLREARACYLRWGADAKVAQLERLYPHLVERQAIAPTATLAVRSEQLDLFSVVKASQRISGDIELESLAGTLLEVALEQGGARRSCLLLQRDGALFVEAEASVEAEGVTTRILPSLALESSSLVPVSVVQYARATRQPAIVEDVAAATVFTSDPYFARHPTRSVLCLPILRQAELVGLLYLENRFIAGAFTPDRLTALSLLAAQAAISLENALLLAREREARVSAEEARRAAERARAAIEEAERRSAFLAEAGVLLSESLAYEQTLTRLGGLCVQSLADWCVLDLVQDGELRRLAGACADPAKEALLTKLRGRHPARWDSPHPAARALRAGEPVWVPTFTEELLRTMCDDDEHLELVRALGACSVLAVPLVARGQTLGVLSLASGTPGRYGRADLELAQEVAHRAALAIENARLHRETQRAVSMRDEFLQVASHELRTPVAGLSLSIKGLQKALGAPRGDSHELMRQLLDLADRQGTRLTRLLEDVMDVSRVEVGWAGLHLEEVELGALVRDAAARFEADLTRSGCCLSIHFDGPVLGRWDRSRIDRVVTNLLSNAVKFGAGKPIEIRVEETSGRALLSVRDHGIGVDPLQLGRIFGRFQRAVSPDHYGGLGLGLYISRRIVEAHGGTIRAESAPGEGSTFTLELPRAGP